MQMAHKAVAFDNCYVALRRWAIDKYELDIVQMPHYRESAKNEWLIFDMSDGKKGTWVADAPTFHEALIWVMEHER
jgi:hypothetical protein